MAEPTFASPIIRTYVANPDASLRLADHTALTKLVIRAAVGTAAKAHLAVAFGASRMSHDVLIAGTRPDEWMLIGDAEPVSVRVESLPMDGHVSIIDWTHGRCAFRLAGPDSTKVLEKVCSIDWSDAMTPDGAVLSATVAGVACDIVRADQGDSASYLILSDRSFGQYLFDAIFDAGTEFGISAE